MLLLLRTQFAVVAKLVCLMVPPTIGSGGIIMLVNDAMVTILGRYEYGNSMTDVHEYN